MLLTGLASPSFRPCIVQSRDGHTYKSSFGPPYRVRMSKNSSVQAGIPHQADHIRIKGSTVLLGRSTPSGVYGACDGRTFMRETASAGARLNFSGGSSISILWQGRDGVALDAFITLLTLPGY